MFFQTLFTKTEKYRIFIIMKKKTTSITLTPEIQKKLEDGKYNKSKLIDSLLTEHYAKKKK